MTAETHRVTVDRLLAEARSRIARLAPAEVAGWVASGAVVVDIRCEEDRRRFGAIPGAVHIPRTVLEWRVDPSSEHRDSRIAGHDLVLVCNQGFSSSLAAAVLADMGVGRVADVDGGFAAWVAAGLPVETYG